VSLVRFSRKALADIERISQPLADCVVNSAWWQDHRPEAPHLVADELASALALLEESPGLGVPYAVLPRGPVRRLLLIDSQVHIYYRSDQVTGDVEVLRIWGARRKRGPAIH
jgi:plasmid stabilization system protein ParE